APGYTGRPAPVAHGIERCPAEAEVACSNHAGRTPSFAGGERLRAPNLRWRGGHPRLDRPQAAPRPRGPAQGRLVSAWPAGARRGDPRARALQRVRPAAQSLDARDLGGATPG